MTSNSANRNLASSPKPLEKSFRILAIVNINLGAFAIILQFAVIVSWFPHFADWISTGFWGGSFFIATGAVIIQRKNGKTLLILAIFSILCGLAMLVVYIWNMVTASYWNNCYNYSDYCDRRYTVDTLFIIFGITAVIVNTIIAEKAMEIQSDQQSFPVTMTDRTEVYVNGKFAFPVETLDGPYNQQHHVVMTSNNTFADPYQPQILYCPANQQASQARFVDAPPSYDAHQFNDSSTH